MKLTNKTVVNSIYISFFIQIITTLYAITSINHDVPEKDAILKDILKLELFVQFIESLFYFWIIYTIKKVKDVTQKRYNDWFITTPIMLISFTIFLQYQEYKENNIDNKLSLADFLKNNDIIKKIITYNSLMLLFGYFAEKKMFNKELSIIIGFFFFYLTFKTIYDNYAIKSILGKKLFTLMCFIWGLYGVAAFYDYNTKNIAYNILDVIAKNFFGMYLSYKIKKINTMDQPLMY